MRRCKQCGGRLEIDSSYFRRRYCYACAVLRTMLARHHAAAMRGHIDTTGWYNTRWRR